MIRLKGPTSVKMMQVIKVTAKKGLGIEGDPVREIVQYWDTEGNLLAEIDTDPTYLCDLVKWESDRARKIIEEHSRKIGRDISSPIKDSATKIDGKALYQATQDK